MTISSTVRKAGPYVGAGTTATFAFAFKVFADNDLLVVEVDGDGNITPLYLTADFTVSLNGDQNSSPGGTITLVAGNLPVGTSLIISSAVAQLQGTDLQNGGGFFPDVINDSLDKATILVQQLQEVVDRSLRFPITDEAMVVELPSATDRANKYFTFAGDGSLSLADVAMDGSGIFTNFVAQRINSIRFANQFEGSDLGVKINAAFTDLAGPGEVWVNQAAGTTISTPVTVPTKCVLRFIQGGSPYLCSAAVTVAQGGMILGPGSAMTDGSDITSSVVLKCADSSNLPALIIASSAMPVISGVYLEGNSPNNASGGVAIAITAARARIENVNVANFKSHGITLTSTGTSNQAAGAVLHNCMVIASGGDGIRSTNTTDVFLLQTESQNNGGYGLNIIAGGAVRIVLCDFGGNASGGFTLSGISTAAILNGSFLNVNGCDFGNNRGNDILINGWDAVHSAASVSSCTITGNTFAGLGSTATDNTYDAIKLQDCSGITITGNAISSITSHRYKYGIESVNVSSSAGANTIGLNAVNGLVGTAALSLKSTDIAVGNIEYSSNFGRLQNGYLANNANLNAQDSGGTIHAVVTLLDGSDSMVINNPVSGKSVFIENQGSATAEFDTSHNLKLIGKCSRYNNIATVSNGVPSELATSDLTAQGADLAASTIYAVPSSGAGLYRVTAYIAVTRAGSSSSTMPKITMTWTDADSSQAQSFDLTATSGGNVLTTFAQAQMVMNAKASTNIQYATSGWASSGGTSMQYAVHIRIEAL